MGNANYTSFGPPPLATPITLSGDDTGLPFHIREVPRGDLQTAWAQWFNQLYARIVTGAPMVMDLTLTVASTTVAAPTNGVAGELVVILRQDATGGRAVVWGAGFVADSSALDTTASTISTFRFVYSISANQWVMVGQPTTGMTP